VVALREVDGKPHPAASTLDRIFLVNFPETCRPGEGISSSSQTGHQAAVVLTVTLAFAGSRTR
jgi:hypothetical protein